jgi:hypothetical protein
MGAAAAATLTRPGVVTVLDELVALATVEAMTGHLVAAGATGERVDSSRCVLANYLRERTGQRVQVKASRVEWRVADGATAQVRLPEPLCDLIRRFDRGELPQLVEVTPDEC